MHYSKIPYNMYTVHRKKESYQSLFSMNVLSLRVYIVFKSVLLHWVLTLYVFIVLIRYS